MFYKELPDYVYDELKSFLAKQYPIYGRTNFLQFVKERERESYFSNHKYAKIVLDKHSSYFNDFPYESRNVFAVGMEALKKHALHYLSLGMKLKKNPEIVEFAINHYFLNYEHFPQKLKMDMNIIYLLMNNIKNQYEFLQQPVKELPHHFYVNAFIPFKKLKEEDAYFVAISFLNIHPRFLRELPANFKDDKDLILSYFNSESVILDCVSERLKNDYDFVKACIKKQPQNFIYASERLQNDESLGLLALEDDVSIYKDFMVKQTNSLKNNRNIIKKVLSKDGMLLSYIPFDVSKDLEFIHIAIEQNVDIYDYIHGEELRKNNDVLLQLLKKSPYAFHVKSNGFSNVTFSKFLDTYTFNSQSTLEDIVYTLDKEMPLFIKKFEISETQSILDHKFMPLYFRNCSLETLDKIKSNLTNPMLAKTINEISLKRSMKNVDVFKHTFKNKSRKIKLNH
jgi:hypothetical protein